MRGLLLLALTPLAGCSMAPPYRPPTVPTPPTFKEAGPWQPATPGDLAPRGPWWTVYNDATLNRLEAQLDADNPSLAAALGRYDAARADLAQAHAALLPQLGLEADASDNRQSDNRPLRGANQPDLYPADTLGLGASYDPDLWGRVRNNVAAGKAEVQASADLLAAVRLSLEARLALAYVALRGLDAQAVLLTTTADAYRQADALTRRRFQGGIESGLNVSRAGAQLAEAETQQAEVQAARALTEHAIASLTGVSASSFTLAPEQSRIALPALPPLLPSTLLQRRPDVAAAERAMAAANARIGVAKAAFFPEIGLSTSGGFQNTGLATLLSAPNLFWSVGPNLVLTLFDGGRRRAQVAAARAQWSQASADYRTRALTAFQEVEDALAELHHLGDAATAGEQAVTMASQAEALALDRYRKGAVTYLEVVTAETAALRDRQTALDLHTRRLQASIRLIAALGGGWK